MKATTECTRKRRAKTYDCDGICYTSHNMCPGAEQCPESRVTEFVSTVIAVATILLVSVIITVVIVWMTGSMA